MGNFQITMMDGGIADAGETQEVARLKPRPDFSAAGRFCSALPSVSER